MEKPIEKMTKIVSAINDMRAAQYRLEAELRTGPASFYFHKLNDYIVGLFSFSKFKIGDHVKLIHDVYPVPSGWAHCAHFLKQGEPAVIRDVDYGDGSFSYMIVFDNESRIDKKGKVHPKSDKSFFHFKEHSLELKEANQ